MSNEEHYFENLLFAYSRGGVEMYDKVEENDSNIQYLTNDVKRAIETCASYVIDCCGWDNKVLGYFLDGDFTTPSSESSSQ